MKALVYTKTNKVEYLDYKDPEFKKDESIVKVSASGICGSDMHAYHGKDTRRVPPLILGHEISGTIEQGKNKGAKVIITEKKVKEFQDGILFIQTKNIRKLLAQVTFKIFNKRR